MQAVLCYCNATDYEMSFPFIILHYKPSVYEQMKENIRITVTGRFLQSDDGGLARGQMTVLQPHGLPAEQEAIESDVATDDLEFGAAVAVDTAGAPGRTVAPEVTAGTVGKAYGTVDAGIMETAQGDYIA